MNASGGAVTQRALNGLSDNCFSNGSAKNLLCALKSFIKKHLSALTLLAATLINGRKCNNITEHIKETKSESQTAQTSASPAASLDLRGDAPAHDAVQARLCHTIH